MLGDNLQQLKLAVGAVALGLAVCLVADVVFLTLTRSLIEGIKETGWGETPPAGLNPYLSVAAVVPFITRTATLLYCAGFLCMLFLAGRALPHLGVEKHLNPVMTAVSLPIPFFNLYRPWAGLGEVRNTFAQAIATNRIPAAGVRRAHWFTIGFGACVFLYLALMRLLGNAVDKLTALPAPDSTEAAVGQFARGGGLILLEIMLYIFSLAVFLYYMLGLLGEYRDALQVRERAVPAAANPA